jgi:CRP/FNR family transcriptional regulator, anaerobic regulatory protein
MTDNLCPNFDENAISCMRCRLGKICLPVALSSQDIVKLDEIVKRGRISQRGEHIYRAGETFHAIFAIRSGYIKTYRITDNGDEQITGFYFPGEVFGMDGINKHKYSTSAKALETTAICEIPFTHFQELTIELPNLQMHFFQLMSQEITSDQQLITMLSKKTAEQRIAALLLNISDRNANRGMSATHLRLPMSRTDIGNYLGLTVETVSRIFSRFAKENLIALNQKDVELLDSNSLRTLAAIEE